MYNISFARVNYNTKKGNTAKTRDGGYKRIKNNTTYMSMNSYSYNNEINIKEKRQYFIFSAELAIAMFHL